MRFKVASVLLTLTVLSSIGFVMSASETPLLEWSKTYYGSSGRAIQTADGGYAIAGSNASILFFPAWERAPTLIKTGSSGELQWNKTFEATGHVATSSVVQTKDGGYMLSGSSVIISNEFISEISAGNLPYSGWIIKTDEQGKLEWNKTIELPLERCYIIQTSDENFVLTGYMKNSSNATDGVLMMLDDGGNILWNKTFGGDSSRVFANTVVEANNAGYVVGGSWDGDGWLMKVDSEGNLQWSQTYLIGKSEAHLFWAVTKTSEGGYVLAGGRLDSACLIKTDSFGNMDWNRVYPAAGSLGFISVAEIKGGYVVVSQYDKQAWIAKVDENGDLLYDIKFGDVDKNNSSSVSSVIATDDGGFAVAGRLNSYSPSTSEDFQITPFVGDDVWLAKFAADSDLTTPTSVPNFPLWVVLSVFAIAVLLAAVIVRRKKSVK
ncbi:MAG: hypothetical protein WC325_12655 [Candidatus Bathyarchaeia archaeon]|jgi:hypothetical protein